MSQERSRSDFNFEGVAAQPSTPDALMLAIVNHRLPGDEVALVIRTRTSTARGMVILSEQALDDHALFLATSALEIDTRRFPAVDGSRVIHVWNDGRVTSDEGEYVGAVDMSLLPPDRTSGLVEYLRARTVSESTVEIPRVGRARVFTF